MAVIRKIKKDIYCISVDDNITKFFEGVWPIPNGVSYNTYLILGEKNVLIEGGVKKYFTEDFLSALENIIDLKDLDYIIINHTEPDHTGSLSTLIKLTNAKILVSKFGALLLNNFYGISGDRVSIANNQTSLGLGNYELKFFLTPGTHWPDSMVTYEKNNGILFSSDIFGSFGALNGRIFDYEIDLNYFLGEAKRYFVNIIGKHVANAKRALTTLSKINIQIIAPSHGPVWINHKDKILELYSELVNMNPKKKVLIVYGTMYGFSQELAYYITNKLVERGIKVSVINATEEHPSYTLSEAWDSKVIILGGPTYDNGAFPPLITHTKFFVLKNIKNKKFAIFGSSGWSGGGYKELVKELQNLNWELIEPIVEYRGRVTKDVLKKTDTLIDKILEFLEG